jgi:hypothetical protein
MGGKRTYQITQCSRADDIILADLTYVLIAIETTYPPTVRNIAVVR